MLEKWVVAEVPINELWKGHILAESIYKVGPKGQKILLLREGFTLNESIIHTLRKHQVKEFKVYRLNSEYKESM